MTSRVCSLPFRGERLQRPSDVPDAVWLLVLKCWERMPGTCSRIITSCMHSHTPTASRPRFTQISSDLKRLQLKECGSSTLLRNLGQMLA